MSEPETITTFTDSGPEDAAVQAVASMQPPVKRKPGRHRKTPLPEVPTPMPTAPQPPEVQEAIEDHYDTPDPVCRAPLTVDVPMELARLLVDYDRAFRTSRDAGLVVNVRAALQVAAEGYMVLGGFLGTYPGYDPCRDGKLLSLVNYLTGRPAEVVLATPGTAWNLASDVGQVVVAIRPSDWPAEHAYVLAWQPQSHSAAGLPEVLYVMGPLDVVVFHPDLLIRQVID